MKTYLTVALCLCGFAGVLQARKPKLADAPHAYVTNSLDNTVSVIDTGTNRVTAIVPVGRNPLGLAVGRTAIYVANSEDNTVSVIDPITNEVTKTIQVPYISPFSGGIGAAVGLALSPDESTLYIADVEAGLAEINTATGAVVFIDGSNTSGVTVSPNGDVYVLVHDYQLWVLNHTTNTLTSQVGNDFPIALAVSPDAATLYVIGFNPGGSYAISVINAATNTITDTIPVAPRVLYSSGIAVSSDGRAVYIANSGDNTVSVINTAANKVKRTISVGKTPEGVAVSDGGFVYVVNSADNSVSVIDPATDIVTAVISVGSGATKIAIQ